MASTSPSSVSNKAHRVSSAPTTFLAVNESELEEGSARPLLKAPSKPDVAGRRSRAASIKVTSKEKLVGGDDGGNIIDDTKVPTKNKLGTFMGVFVPAVVSGAVYFYDCLCGPNVILLTTSALPSPHN